MTMTILGCKLSFERRRYGGRSGATYTWAYANGVSLGDPWPCITPKISELEAVVRLMIERKEVCPEPPARNDASIMLKKESL